MIVVATFVVSSIITLKNQRSPNEPYIGKMYGPHAGPTHPGNPRPHFILYDSEPYLQFSPGRSSN